jgi:hypothetical protein
MALFSLKKEKYRWHLTMHIYPVIFFLRTPAFIHSWESRLQGTCRWLCNSIGGESHSTNGLSAEASWAHIWATWLQVLGTKDNLTSRKSRQMSSKRLSIGEISDRWLVLLSHSLTSTWQSVSISNLWTPRRRASDAPSTQAKASAARALRQWPIHFACAPWNWPSWS